MPSLVVIFGRDRGRHFDLPRGSNVTIGRDKLLSNRLNDPSISRKHVGFVHQAEDDEYVAIDLESRNGARINQKRLVRKQTLNDGDIIQVGYTLLVFVRVTFEACHSIEQFLHDCEDEYAEYLGRLRRHTAMHVEHEDAHTSRGSMSGTLHLGTLFGKKH